VTNKKTTNPIFNTNGIKISLSPKPMTAYGGFALLAIFFEKLALKENISKIFPVTQTSPNAIPVSDKILSLLLTVFAGGERFAHLLYLASGGFVLSKLFGLERLPKAASTLSRFFAKISSWAQIEKLAAPLWDYIFTLIPFDKIKADWLDLDSSVITRYGTQEGALRGYNPKKKGRASHHPLLAFLSEARFVVNLWNRSGNSRSANNAIAFFEQTYNRLKGKIVFKGVRADSGFYEESFLETLERLALRYVIPAVLYPNLQRHIWGLTDWQGIADGYSVATFRFKPDKWTQERRYVVIRREISRLKSKAVGKLLPLFDDEARYTYSCFVTNDEGSSPEQIWRDYRPRANDENVIKEYKEDFALCGFCQENFYATEAGMLIRALALNLLSLFKRDILEKQTKGVERLKTIRFKYFVIPSVLGSGQKYDILRLSVVSQGFRSKMIRLLNRVTSYAPAFLTNCNAVAPPTSTVGG
jgi:hypothetical protein